MHIFSVKPKPNTKNFDAGLLTIISFTDIPKIDTANDLTKVRKNSPNAGSISISLCP